MKRACLSVVFLLFSLGFLIYSKAISEEWGLVTVSVANVREEASHASELGSQVVMGHPVKILGKNGHWYKVECADGYMGYMIDNSLALLSEPSMRQWKQSPRVVVVASDQIYIEEDSDDSHKRVSDAVNGSILRLTDVFNMESSSDSRGYLRVILPDGRPGRVRKQDVMLIGEWGNDVFSATRAIDLARSQMGVSYLWGGTSIKGMDCSGLVKICWLDQGYILPRNASQQAKCGKVVKDENPQAGDLLFFGNRQTGRVNHVGLSLGGNRFIHSSGRVKENSLTQEDDDFVQLTLICTRRFDDHELQCFSVKTHPWYF